MTRQTTVFLRVLILLLLVTASACEKGSDLPASAIVAGKYIILDTRTDQGDSATAKKNAENTLKKYPDIDAMVGLWAYNTPQCLEAVKDARMEGKVKLISFDEDSLTLQGIKDGHVHGTVVQQPYEFGYQSMKYLNALAEGDTSVIPSNKTLDIPTKVIKRDNVDEFWANLKELLELGKTAKAEEKQASTGEAIVKMDGEERAVPITAEAAKKPEKPAGGHHFAFVVNVPNEFWNYARAGCYKAEQDFGLLCEFKIPHDGSSAEQNRILETLIQKDEIKGIAVSPLDPKNQTALLNQVAEKVTLLCHDSDAPDSNRLFYLGTNNYLGGRQVGKLVKEALPDGGKLMIFVGKLDVLNAQQRRQGVIDELMDKPMPE